MFIHEVYDILGKEKIFKLATNFYTNVWNDSDCPWFRDLFAKDQEIVGAALLLGCYCGQKWGGGERFGGFQMPPGTVQQAHLHHKIDMEGLVRWKYHWIHAMKASDLGEHQEEVEECIMSWVNAFGKTVVNCAIYEKSSPESRESDYSWPIKKNSQIAKVLASVPGNHIPSYV